MSTPAIVRLLRITPGVSARVLGPDSVELWSRNSLKELAGSGCGLVVELVDGTRSADDIARALADRMDPAVAHYTILQLLAGGQVEESDTSERVTPPLPPVMGHISIHQEAGGLVHVCRAEAAMPLPHQGRVPVCGSGMSAELAERSARWEAAERYSLHYQTFVPIIRGDWDQVEADALPAGEFLLFSEAQQTKRGGYRLADVKDWVEVTPLTGGRRRLVPAACCYFGLPDTSDGPLLCASSNGCAGGATWDDAVSMAFLEAVERDAISIWWYNRVARPRVPMPEPFGASVAAALADEGHRLALLDLTNDLGVPVVAAVAIPDDIAKGLRLGFGASWTIEEAATHAITELCQGLSRPTFYTGGQPISLEPWLIPSDMANLSAHMPPCDGTSLQACLHDAGLTDLDIFVLDQSSPDAGSIVARVIAPGLRPALPRFAPGRLYDVPVRMGWRSVALTEAELNPVPFDI